MKNMIVKKLKALAFLIMALVLLSACRSVKNLYFLCDDFQTEVYVDGEYCGTGQVNVQVPSGTVFIKVECRNNGDIVYQRNYYLSSYENNSLIEIDIPQNYRYKSRNSSEE